MNHKSRLLVFGLTLAIVAALAIAPIVGEMAYAKSTRKAAGSFDNHCNH